MSQSLREYCARYDRGELLLQWHGTKNGTLDPQEISYGSHRPVWWHCDRGHEWKAIIKSRVGGNGCPVCSNRRVITGENDLATLAPTLAAQWHPEKNGALTPGQVSAGSDRRVWWRCSRGHEWQASAATRTAGRGCPVCAGKSAKRI